MSTGTRRSMTDMPGPTWFLGVLETSRCKGDKEELKSMATFITQNIALRIASVGYQSRVLAAIVDMHWLIIFLIQST